MAGSKQPDRSARDTDGGAGPSEHTLFVCVRNRHGHGRSCGGDGSLAFVKDMRAMLAAEAIGPAEMMVRPAGCLGLCGKGPVCVAAAPGSRKPKPPKAKEGRPGVYTRVEEQDLRPMLREVLRPLPGGRGLT